MRALLCLDLVAILFLPASRILPAVSCPPLTVRKHLRPSRYARSGSTPNTALDMLQQQAGVQLGYAELMAKITSTNNGGNREDNRAGSNKGHGKEQQQLLNK